MTPLRDRIRKKFPELSHKMKWVAQYILEHPNEVALHTASEIGKRSNTSETTVIRLCYQLGYKGYTELQEEIRLHLLKTQKENPLRKYRQSTMKSSREKDWLAESLHTDLEYMQEMAKTLDPTLLAQIVEAISTANKVVIVGFRSAFAPAYWLSYALNIIQGNVCLYRGEIDDGNILITDMEQEWVVIAFSFSRYSKATVTFVEAAKKKGATVIGITDDDLAPIGIYSDLLLTVHTPEPAGLKGMPVIFIALNAIVTGCAARNKDLVDRRIEDYEKSKAFYNPFMEE